MTEKAGRLDGSHQPAAVAGRQRRDRQRQEGREQGAADREPQGGDDGLSQALQVYGAQGGCLEQAAEQAEHGDDDSHDRGREKQREKRGQPAVGPQHRRAGAADGGPGPAATEAFPGDDEQGQHHEHEGQQGRLVAVEAGSVGGVDSPGQRLVPQHRHKAEVGERVEADQK